MVAEIRQGRPAANELNLQHMAGYLEHIVRQVQAEGYYVEWISSFNIDGRNTAETIDAVSRRAKHAGLKVSFNQERGICFFEKP